MDMLATVKTLAHEMRLPGLQAALERRSTEALSDQMHPLDFVRLLLEDERCHRKQTTAKRLIRGAKFRRSIDLEDWDASYDRGLSRQRQRDICALNFFHLRENLLILGRTGTGKTHLAMALGKRLCWEGHATRFFSTNLLFEEVAAEKAAGRYLNFLTSITKMPVIILDDFGLRNYSHDEATILLDIIEARYQKGIVVMTSQVDPQGWPALFSDVVIREAIVNRLTQPSQRIELKGSSYRDHLSQAPAPGKSIEEKVEKN